MPVSSSGYDVRTEIFNRNPFTIYETGLVAVTVTPERFHGPSVFVVVTKNYYYKGGVMEALMDPKLVRQFIIFLIILFGWTIVILLFGCK